VTIHKKGTYADYKDVFGSRNAQTDIGEKKKAAEDAKNKYAEAAKTADANKEELEQLKKDVPVKKAQADADAKVVNVRFQGKDTEVSSSMKLYIDACVTEADNSQYEMIKRKAGTETVKGKTDDGYKICQTFPSGNGGVRLGFNMGRIVPPGKCKE